MFEKATRLKLRFGTEAMIGLNCEDLWDIPLMGNQGNDLESIAKALHNEIKTDEEVSFVKVKNSVDKVLSLKFDIVKHIIDVRLAELEAKENEVDTKAKRLQLLAIKAEKQKTELLGKSVEEIDKLLAELD